MTSDARIEKYGQKVKRLACKICRTYGLPSHVVEEIQQEALLALLIMPERFVNNAGVMFYAKAKIIKALRSQMPAGKRSCPMSEIRKVQEVSGGGNTKFSKDGEDDVEKASAELNGTNQVESGTKYTDAYYASLHTPDTPTNKAHLYAAIARLSDAQRTVLELKYGLGDKPLSYKQIARRLGHRVSWVKARLLEAISRLQNGNLFTYQKGS